MYFTKILLIDVKDDKIQAMKLNNSPIQKISYNNRQIFIKRDDLLHKDFSGNKARKFHFLFEDKLEGIDTIISHGSVQSNAMYSLSSLCKIKNKKFIYYVDHIPSNLKENPIGNYKYALQNEMIIKQDEIPSSISKNELFIIEGGAVKQASIGIEKLANEITHWVEENNIKNLKVFLPSGTGTTALYLQKYLPYEVLTCACVGDEEYLQKQFEDLENKENSLFPAILKREKKYHFGKLYKEFYEKYLDLKEKTNIEFDLLYDSLGWIVFEKFMQENDDKNYTYLYIHQGGILGNESMISRYEYKFKR